jgi:hypothetical protein
VRLGSEIDDYVGLPSLERLGNGMLVSNVSVNEGVAWIVSHIPQIQRTPRIRQFVNYDYAPVSFA